MSSLKGGMNRPPFEGIYVYLLILIIGYILADLTILKVRPLMLPSGNLPTDNRMAIEETSIPRGEYTVITIRNLFNADGMIPPALSAKGLDSNAPDAPAVLLRVELPQHAFV